MLKYNPESCRLFRIHLPPVHMYLALLKEVVQEAVCTKDELRPLATQDTISSKSHFPISEKKYTMIILSQAGLKVH